MPAIVVWSPTLDTQLPDLLVDLQMQQAGGSRLLFRRWATLDVLQERK